jgi:TolA-binding protein
MNCFRFALLALLLAGTAAAADKERATLIREVTLYASPAENSEKLGQVERGSDITVLERSGAEGSRQWVKAVVTLRQADNSRQVTGWLVAGPVVGTSTANADQIIYGEAVNAEREAEMRGGRRGAAEEAFRLYQRVADLFPNSPLAGEANWHLADIRWQLDSAKNKNKAPLDEQLLQNVIKKHPGSKWADLAAFDLLDNKLCPEWRGLPECPLKESTIYEQYAREHPQSPKAPEALYWAAWRQAVLADMFRINGQKASSTAARTRALALAQELANSIQPEWKSRATILIYKLQQNITIYGVAQ